MRVVPPGFVRRRVLNRPRLALRPRRGSSLLRSSWPLDAAPRLIGPLLLGPGPTPAHAGENDKRNKCAHGTDRDKRAERSAGAILARPRLPRRRVVAFSGIVQPKRIGIELDA